MSTLVRIESPAGQCPHLHENLIVCRDHLAQLGYAAEPLLVELSAAQVVFWGWRCLMCGVASVADRRCVNEACARALHPCWPAVYCCDNCARVDA